MSFVVFQKAMQTINDHRIIIYVCIDKTENFLIYSNKRWIDIISVCHVKIILI